MDKQKYENQKRKKKITYACCIIAASATFLSMIIPPLIPKKEKTTIVIGSKAYTEQQILGNILAEVIKENPDFNVEKKIGLGGTSICYDALKENSIDLYVEYSAGIYLNQLGLEFKQLNKNEIINTIAPLLEKDNVILGTRLGFVNDYELTVTKKFAEQNDLSSIADLKSLENEVVVAPTFEYVNREDGMLGINSIYGINFENIIPMEAGLRYSALEAGEVDVINTFTTDGMKYKLDLVALEDPEHVHMSQEAVVIMNKEKCEKCPELTKTISVLEGKITNDDMMKMNYEVDVEGKTPEEVAREFLLENGLIENNS